MGRRCRGNYSQLIIKRHVITPTASLHDSHITVIAVIAGAGSMPSEPTGAPGGRRPRKEASMIGRNKRGIRRASMRGRLAVAAAVLVGGGAAGAGGGCARHSSAAR